MRRRPRSSAGEHVLTPSEIESLRAGVVAAGKRPPQPGPFRWVLCEDGPLAGIGVRLAGEGRVYEGASFGWCELTRRGAVVASYVPSLDPERWRFKGYDRPGQGGDAAPYRPHGGHAAPAGGAEGRPGTGARPVR